MSEDNKVSKTKLVRELLEKNPALKPMDIVKIMGEKGVEITNRYVSIIKNKVKNTRSEKKISLPKRRLNSSKHDNSDLNDLIAVKGLYETIGSDRIIAAVKALEQLMG